MPLAHAAVRQGDGGTMKKTRRTSRVGEMIRNALVEVLRHDVKDISLGLTSITEVEVSPDLHLARVFLSSLTEEEAKAAVKELQNARGRIRHALGQRIHLRFTPDLEFKYDDTPIRAGRIEDLLQKVMPKAETAGEGENEDEDE
jgi:ribosome-binding factor A